MTFVELLVAVVLLPAKRPLVIVQPRVMFAGMVGPFVKLQVAV